MEYVDVVRDWLGIDALISMSMHIFENVLLAAGPSRWILGAVALAFAGFLITRLLGGGRW